MLKEFALDPELLSNWKDFRFFTSQFGAENGRLISRFPGNWDELVKAAAKGAKDIEFLKIIEALNRIKALMFVREYRTYTKGHQWIRNAIEENEHTSFRAIVSTKHDGRIPNLIVGGDIDPTNPPDLWVVPTSIHIERTPEAMAACVKDLLSQCDEVLFIDPFFGPGKRQHTEPLRRFLEAIASRGTRRMPTRVEYHSGDLDQDTVTLQNNLDRWVKAHLATSVTLTVVRWKKSEMHNRYILTDRGGVMFGHGLDNADGKAVTHDTVSLLDAQTCANLRIDYSDQSKKLTWLNDKFSVTGT